jgi:hypothetical protein
MEKPTFNVSDVYDKNINFLIGSGASYGLFPTLALGIKEEVEEEGEAKLKDHTIETLATRFPKETDDWHTLVFMHYYKTCIEPVLSFSIDAATQDPNKKKVIDNYQKFLETLLLVLQRRRNFEKCCNVFTTNYDGCFAHVADSLLKRGGIDFVVNDGARGFSKRYLQAKNFNSFVCQTGVFERHKTDIPQINLIHLHGSIYWRKDGENILVDYSEDQGQCIENLPTTLEDFSSLLLDKKKKISDLTVPDLEETVKSHFWENYDKIPIVNPTKWKFHETVFEEHYYQMLRLLSYELEKPNSIFITFGFSFADEHILNLVKRSLSNPSLQVFVCCFDNAEAKKMKHYFGSYRNVQLITVDGCLDFTRFNSDVFTTTPKPSAPDDEG